MIFLFKKFWSAKIYSTWTCQASYSKEHLHCTISHQSACRSIFAGSEQVAEDLEATRRSLFRPVAVGLHCLQGSGYYCCLKLCYIALTQAHSLAAAGISNTQFLFIFF